MWILENWHLHNSTILVKRAFRKAFKLETHQLPKRDQAFKDEYDRMKKNKSVCHLEPGPKVRPDRFKLIPECQDEEKVERVRLRRNLELYLCCLSRICTNFLWISTYVGLKLTIIWPPKVSSKLCLR